MSFVLYNIFNILLCIIIIIIGISNSILKQGHESTFMLLFGMDLSQNISQSATLSIPTVNVEIYVLMYGIMLLSIWDNLYSFHRYYSTYKTTNIKTVYTIEIIKRYIIFAVIFVILFVIQIHLIYWLFPVIVFIHFSFNIYCNSQFKNLIVNHYQSSENISENLKIIQKAKFLWKISLICCILQSLSLGLFFGAYKYNPNVLYFFPLFWCSAAIYSVSFVRNKKYLQNRCTIRMKKPVIEPINISETSTKPTKQIQHVANNSVSSSTVSTPMDQNSKTVTQTQQLSSTKTVPNGLPVTALIAINSNSEEMTFPKEKCKIARGSSNENQDIYTSIQEEELPVISMHVNVGSISDVKLIDHNSHNSDTEPLNANDSTLQSLKAYGFF